MFSGWCGEVRDVIYSENGTVTVVYRVILKGTDGEVFLTHFSMEVYTVSTLIILCGSVVPMQIQNVTFLNLYSPH